MRFARSFSLCCALGLSFGCVEEAVEPTIEFFAIDPAVTQAGATVLAEVEVSGVQMTGHDHVHPDGHSHHHEGPDAHVHLFLDTLDGPSLATLTQPETKVTLPDDLAPGHYTVVALLHGAAETAEVDLEIVP